MDGRARLRAEGRPRVVLEAGDSEALLTDLHLLGRSLLAIGLAAAAPLALALPAGGAARAADPPPSGCAGTGPCVIVELYSGDSRVGPLQYFYADDVIGNADIHTTSYLVRTQPGQEPSSDGIPAASSVGRLVAEALAAQGDTMSQVTFAEVDGTDPYRHLLTRTELGPAGSNGFQGDLMPAFYGLSGSPPAMFGYIRPLRGDDDVNGGSGPDLGLLSSTQLGSLVIRVHMSGQPLDVSASVTPDAAHRSFTFTSTPTGPGHTFEWHFPDGSTSTDATPSFTFPDGDLAGSYPVTVGVEDTSDGSFGYGTVAVQVGDPPTPSSGPSTPGTGGGGGASQGPTRSPSGSPSGTPNPHPTPGQGSSGSTHPSTTPTTTPSPSATSSSTPTTTPSRAPSAPTSTQPTTPPTARPDRGDTEQVTGILLSADDRAPPPDGTVLDVPPPSPSAAPLTRPPLRVDPLVWGAVAGVVLLGAGAASESDRVRRRARRWLRMGP